MLDEWLARLTEKRRGLPDAARFGVNQIMHRTNARLEQDVALGVKCKVLAIIPARGARADVNQTVHGYGGIVLHDVIDDRFEWKAFNESSNGMIAVAPDGCAGTLSPFAFVEDLRSWWEGPFALCHADSTPGASYRTVAP